jgi:hypothetical protein
MVETMKESLGPQEPVQAPVQEGSPEVSRETIEAPVETPVEASKEPDLISRVSAVQKEQKEQATLNLQEIEKIEDPVIKERALNTYKEMERGWQKKYQALAEERKQIEEQKAKKSQWTPEDVQALLNDPTFVQAAQSVTGEQVEDEEYSALSDSEKQKIVAMEKELNSMKQQNVQTYLQQQHESLKAKYSNYSPEAVSEITSELLANKRNATLEDVWKSYDYNDAIERAYQLGKNDKGLDTQVKVSSSSVEGVNVNSQAQPEQIKDETNRDFFKRLVLDNIVKSKR